MNRVAASRFVGSLVFGLGLAALPTLGQVQGTPLPEGSAPDESPAWGTSGFTVHTVNSFAFVPFDSATQYAGDGNNGRYSVSGGFAWEAPVLLPSGALLDHMEIDGCDNAAGSGLISTLYVCQGSSCATPLVVTTSGVPGCGTFASGSAPTTVDNRNKTYTIEIETPGGSQTIFRAVRFFYKLQVSPAPATATFNDVPTGHAQFRFIEALAAAGITGGCGNGNYCPLNPVTRGQMAVFLSVALGLYFPN